MRAFRAHQRKQPARQSEVSGEVKEEESISQKIEANFKAQGSHRLKPEKWRAAFDAEGKVTGFRKALKYIIAGGVDHSIRCEVWEFLLGCYDLGSTSIAREQVRQARRKRYKELIEQCRTMHVSVGTGTLAYTVGSKIMDARITSKESAKKMARQVVDASTIQADENSPSASPMDYEYQQPLQYDEWVDNSVAQSPVDFSFTSMTSPCLDNDTPFYSDLSETEADPREVAHHQPLKSLIERDCETVTPRYSPGRIGPNSPNVLHAKFFQQSSSSVNKSSSNLGRLKAKVQELQMKGVPYELRMAGMPSPNPGVLQFSEERCAEWLWTLHKIVIDVVRTDRHLKFYEDVRNLARMSDILAVYAWIDPATGYCQGMSDLLSPFLVLYENDADAFWCFESLLKRVRQNFQMEGPVGVMQQLKALPKIVELTDSRMFRHLVLLGAESFLFAFRMLLLHFRRELPFPESLRMWEMIWAADFDVSSCLSLEHDFKAPSISLQQRLREEDSLEYPATKLSPYASPQASSEAPPRLSYQPRSPLCGLGPRRFWGRRFSSHGAAARTPSLGRNADNDISVFILAAILITNRAKFLKEARSVDDIIKMFNEVRFKIKVRTCIQTALKLRVAYRQQIARRSMAANP